MKKTEKVNVLFYVFLVILIAAVIGAVVYMWQRRQKPLADQQLAEEVAAELSESEPESGEDETTVTIPVDFEALQETNPDIYAWIHIEDTVIDYPIVQSETDDDYYLDHTVEGESGLPGSIYTQYSYNSGCFEDNVTLIYGHNMRNDTYFGSLSEYTDEEFRNGHSAIEIYTPEHIYTYRVVFAVTYDNRHILAAYDCSSLQQYQSLLTSIQTERTIPSWIEDPFTVTTADKMIILSTCNGNSSQRFLVGAVMEQIDLEDVGESE